MPLDALVHLHRLTGTPARGLIAVRPDGSVGFRCQTADANQLAAWLSLVSAADHRIHTQNAATQPPHPDRLACPPGTCLPVTATGIDIGSAKRAAVSPRASRWYGIWLHNVIQRQRELLHPLIAAVIRALSAKWETPSCACGPGLFRLPGRRCRGASGDTCRPGSAGGGRSRLCWWC